MHGRASWRLEAKCLLDPIARTTINFIHPRSDDETHRALATCATCDVRQECLNWAVEFGEIGIWGGTTEAERIKLDNLRPCPTCGEATLLMVTNTIHVCTSCGLVA